MRTAMDVGSVVVAVEGHNFQSSAFLAESRREWESRCLRYAALSSGQYVGLGFKRFLRQVCLYPVGLTR